MMMSTNRFVLNLFVLVLVFLARASIFAVSHDMEQAKDVIRKVKYEPDNSKACPVIVSRADWRARPPKAREDMHTPVPYVILHHTLSPDVCFNYEDCCKDMRGIQNFHMDTRGWDDIAYSFLVGEDGLAYEGRGWDTVGAHAGPGYNSRSIGISIIGNFTAKLPNQKAIDAVNYVIDCAIENNKLDPNYVLYGHRQVMRNRTCPGEALFKEIQSWPHWKPGQHYPPQNADGNL